MVSLEPKKFMGDDGTIIRFYDDLIACEDEQHEFDGVHASVEYCSTLESRVTLTKMLAVGLLAFTFKKKSGEEKYLTVEDPSFACVALANRKHISNAMRFATAINDAARKTAIAKQKGRHPTFTNPNRCRSDTYPRVMYMTMTALNEDCELDESRLQSS